MRKYWRIVITADILSAIMASIAFIFALTLPLFIQTAGSLAALSPPGHIVYLCSPAAGACRLPAIRMTLGIYRNHC